MGEDDRRRRIPRTDLLLGLPAVALARGRLSETAIRAGYEKFKADKAAQDMALRRGVPLSPPNPETCRNAMARRFTEDLDDLIAAIYPTTH